MRRGRGTELSQKKKSPWEAREKKKKGGKIGGLAMLGKPAMGRQIGTGLEKGGKGSSLCGLTGRGSCQGGRIPTGLGSVQKRGERGGPKIKNSRNFKKKGTEDTSLKKTKTPEEKSPPSRVKQKRGF